jgi:hypothetical protein
MTTFNTHTGEHDPQAWTRQMEEIAKREAAKILKERKCEDDCGALIRIQEAIKNDKDKITDLVNKINSLSTRFDLFDNKINELILGVAKGSTGIVAAVFLSIAGAVITKILKWW